MLWLTFFTFLLAYFEQKVLIFIKFYISVFSFTVSTFYVEFRNFCLSLGHEDILLFIISQKLYYFICHIQVCDSSGIDFCMWVMQGVNVHFSPYGFTVDLATLIKKLSFILCNAVAPLSNQVPYIYIHTGVSGLHGFG